MIMDNNRRVWMRLGAFIHVTNEEYDVLMSGDPQGGTILRNVLDRGDF